MRIAITGARGRVGHAIAETALRAGHSVVAIDRIATGEAPSPKREPLPPLSGDVTEIIADTGNYEALLKAFEGCDALIHMAAIPAPFFLPDDVVHNNNVVGSYNAMRAAVEQGIMKICQASSVNAIGLSFSRAPHFDYFPIDEKHPPYNEEPYGLSKWICEAQADSFARRYEGIRIASMRFHLVAPDRAFAAKIFSAETAEQAKHLWAYTRFDAAADACLRSLEADFSGHEVFYIVGPDTTLETPTLELARKFFPGVPVRGDLSGNKSFFDSSKAERMLGWSHPRP
ncbi:MAG TPA: NAD(P)-dependent oxidoreductase [Devosia sp.]|nr:NAD(P)-dependent oxidoreductase [Devosia sp.]